MLSLGKVFPESQFAIEARTRSTCTSSVKVNKELTSESELADELVPADRVKVHDLDVEGAIADLLPGNVELERGVEDGVQVALVNRRLLLLHAFIAEHQPDLDVRI